MYNLTINFYMKTKQDKNIYDTISFIGFSETENLLRSFLLGTSIKTDDKTGLILSAFIPYYNKSDADISDEATISSFIQYAIYRGTKPLKYIEGKSNKPPVESGEDFKKRWREKFGSDPIL